MAAVVLELQREAMDRAVQVSDLLRKALVVARKLSLADFPSWIQRELNGYAQVDEIPPYRRVRGEIRGWNPMRGWVPIRFENLKEQEFLSVRSAAQSVAELEVLFTSTNRKSADRRTRTDLVMPYDAETEREIASGLNVRVPTQVALFVPPVTLVRIIDTVRTIVLNWALELEGQGILGEGLSFNAGEKQTAGRAASTISNFNNFYGDVHGSQIQQGGGSQTMTSPAMDVAAILAVMGRLRADLEKLDLSNEQRSEVEADIVTAESQACSPKPKVAIIRESLRSLRSVLEKAGGSAAGQLLIELGKLIL